MKWYLIKAQTNNNWLLAQCENLDEVNEIGNEMLENPEVEKFDYWELNNQANAVYEAIAHNNSYNNYTFQEIINEYAVVK